MARKMSMEIMAIDDGSPKKPSIEESFKLLPAQEQAGQQFTLLSDDVLLRNGRFAGKRVSEIVHSVEGRDFLGQFWKLANNDVRGIMRRFFSE